MTIVLDSLRYLAYILIFPGFLFCFQILCIVQILFARPLSWRDFPLLLDVPGDTRVVVHVIWIGLKDLLSVHAHGKSAVLIRCSMIDRPEVLHSSPQFLTKEIVLKSFSYTAP